MPWPTKNWTSIYYYIEPPPLPLLLLPQLHLVPVSSSSSAGAQHPSIRSFIHPSIYLSVHPFSQQQQQQHVRACIDIYKFTTLVGLGTQSLFRYQHPRAPRTRYTEKPGVVVVAKRIKGLASRYVGPMFCVCFVISCSQNEHRKKQWPSNRGGGGGTTKYK